MAINFRDQIGDRPMFRLPGVDPRNPITERGTVPAAQPLVPPGSIVLPKRMEASRPVQIAALPEPTVSQLSSESTVAQPLKVNTRDFAVGLSRPDAGEVEGEEKEVTDSQREDVTNAIITASNKAAGAKANEIGVDPRQARAVAEAQSTKAQEASRVLNKPIETEDDYKALLKQLGPEEIDYDNWKSEAKKLLEIDENEADVPDWAAPMFLFGLNLMKGPVSSKTQGQTGLGGFLSDLGAAGEKGFSVFAAERARKSKQRAQIASVAIQLQGADRQRRADLISAYKASQASKLALSKQVGSTMDKMTDRLINIIPDRDEEKKLEVFDLIGDAFSQLRGFVPDQQLVNPATTTFIQKYVAQRLNITKKPAEFTFKEIGGVDYAWDPKTLRPAMTSYNKANPNNPIQTEIGFLGKLISGDSSVKKYQHLLIGKRDQKSEMVSRNEVGDNGEEITTNYLIDTTARNAWLAANPGYTTEQLKAASKNWTNKLDSFLRNAPTFEQDEYTTKDGEVVKYYINKKALAARRRSQPNFSLQDAFANPEQYTKIIGGKVTDYSKLQPNMATMTVGKGANTKQVFSYDKNAFGKALRDKRIDPTKDDVLKKMIELKIGDYAGDPWSSKTPTTILTVGADGSLMQVTGVDADKTTAGLVSKKEQAAWRQRTQGLASLHRLSWQIDNNLTGDRGRVVTSTLANVGNFFESSVAAVQNLFGGKANISAINSFTNPGGSAKFGNQTITNGLSEDGQALLSKGLNGIRTGEFIFGGQSIEDKVLRSRAESMFVNLAFALASSREGGKLTDNDVRNALTTLGWDNSSFSQSPEAVLSTLRGAVLDASNDYNEAALSIMTQDQAKINAKNIADGNGGIVETLLRNRAKATDKLVRAQTPIYKRYDLGMAGQLPHQLAAEGKQGFRLRYDIAKRDTKLSGIPSGPKAPTPVTIQYMGGSVPVNSSLTDNETFIVNILQKNQIARTPAGLKEFLESDIYKNSPNIKRIFDTHIKSLRAKGFFKP